VCEARIRSCAGARPDPQPRTPMIRPRPLKTRTVTHNMSWHRWQKLVTSVNWIDGAMPAVVSNVSHSVLYLEALECVLCERSLRW
jgi:hypothetical protein